MDGIEVATTPEYSEAFDAMFDAPAEPVAEEPVSEEPQVEEPVAAEEPAVEEEPAEPEAVAETPVAETEQEPSSEELPEGVTVRERNGVKEWVYPEARGRTIFGGYKIAQQAEEVFGEQLTPEVLASRQESHEWLNSQRVDTISDNASDQANVFSNIFRTAAEAIANGEIGHDPLETMPDAFMATLRRFSPEHYDQTVGKLFTSKIQDLYRAAVDSGNEKLLRSVQNLDFHLNKKYLKDDEVKTLGKPQVDEREADLTRREQQIAQHQRRQETERFNTWHGGTKSAINETVKTVVEGQIPEVVRKAFEALPGGKTRLEQTAKLLDLEVQAAIRSDQNWQRQNAYLFKKAQVAPSEQVRESIKQQIVQRFKAKASSVMTAKAKSILDSQTLGMKIANSATKQRLQAGEQSKGTTPGSARPVSRSIPQPSGQKEFMSSEEIGNAIESLFG